MYVYTVDWKVAECITYDANFVNKWFHDVRIKCNITCQNIQLIQSFYYSTNYKSMISYNTSFENNRMILITNSFSSIHFNSISQLAHTNLKSWDINSLFYLQNYLNDNFKCPWTRYINLVKDKIRILRIKRVFFSATDTNSIL